MLADIVGYVYCEHFDWVNDPEGVPGDREWIRERRKEVRCSARAEAILRHSSHRGQSTLRVISFVTFVSTGWIAYVDGEHTCRVYCAKHADIKYSSGRSFPVRS